MELEKQYAEQLSNVFVNILNFFVMNVVYNYIYAYYFHFSLVVALLSEILKE